MSAETKVQPTPGPWEVIPASAGTDARILGYTVVTTDAEASRRHPVVARCYSAGDQVEEHEANACLIAAAPDLLAAARIALVAFHGYEQAGIMVPRDEAREKIRAAIAKAEG